MSYSGSFCVNIVIKERIFRNEMNDFKVLGGGINNGGSNVSVVFVYVDGSWSVSFWLIG